MSGPASTLWADTAPPRQLAAHLAAAACWRGAPQEQQQPAAETQLLGTSSPRRGWPLNPCSGRVLHYYPPRSPLLPAAIHPFPPCKTLRSAALLCISIDRGAARGEQQREGTGREHAALAKQSREGWRGCTKTEGKAGAGGKQTQTRGGTGGRQRQDHAKRRGQQTLGGRRERAAAGPRMGGSSGVAAVPATAWVRCPALLS